MIELVEWLYQRGGWGAIVATMATYAAWRKDRELRAEHRLRIAEARSTAKLLHSLLSRHGSRPVCASLPDDDDESTGVIRVRDILHEQASKELDSDIADLVREYVVDIETLEADRKGYRG